MTGWLDSAVLDITAALTIENLAYNGASGANAAAVAAKRLNWVTAFDLNGDGIHADILNPGFELPVPASLPIDFRCGSATAGERYADGHGRGRRHPHLRSSDGDGRGRVCADAADGGCGHGTAMVVRTCWVRA